MTVKPKRSIARQSVLSPADVGKAARNCVRVASGLSGDQGRQAILLAGQDAGAKRGLFPGRERHGFAAPLLQGVDPRPTHVIPLREGFRRQARIRIAQDAGAQIDRVHAAAIVTSFDRGTMAEVLGYK